MDGLTDRFAISISHVSVLTRDKNIRTTVAKVKQEGRPHDALSLCVIEHFAKSLMVIRSYTVK